MFTAIVFLLILTTAVVVHELAHYWNAKSVGLPVKSFSVGMGPVLFRKMWRGTEWRLSLLPIGGYVDIPGMAPRQDEHGNLHHPTEGFATKNIWQKIWVLVGGVIANFLLAILLMAIVISSDPSYRTFTAGIETVASGARIGGVESGMTAEQLGIQVGDTVRRINDINDPTPAQVRETISTTNGTLTLLLERGGETVTVSTPWPPAEITGDRPLLGIAIEPLSVQLPPRIGFFPAIAESVGFFVRILPEVPSSLARGLGAILSGRQTDDLAGPVRMVQIADQVSRVGLAAILFYAATINLSLAIFNILPIPGLDGGRILLASITALRGKPFKPGQEEFINFLGFMSVIALMLLVTFNDIARFFRN
jgi:regulator of sigma E protease